MRVKLVEGCNLYMINRVTFLHEIVDPENVEVVFIDKRPIFTHKDSVHKDKIIIQAFNHRYALSKMLAQIKEEKLLNKS